MGSFSHLTSNLTNGSSPVNQSPRGTIVIYTDVPLGPQRRERKTRRACLVNLSTLRPSHLIHRFLCGTKTTPAEKVFIDWNHAQGEHGGDSGNVFQFCHQSITFMLESSSFSSPMFQSLGCTHGHGWMCWTVTAWSWGQW